MLVELARKRQAPFPAIVEDKVGGKHLVRHSEILQIYQLIALENAASDGYPTTITTFFDAMRPLKDSTIAGSRL